MAYQRKTRELPMIPVRGIVVFPSMVLDFDIMREKSIASLQEAMRTDQCLFSVTQRDERTEEPQKEDLYQIGTIVKIKQIIRLPHNMIHLLVEGISRAQLSKIESCDRMWISTVKPLKDEPVDVGELEKEALARQLDAALTAYLTENPNGNSEIHSLLTEPSDIGQAVDTIISNIELSVPDNIAILEELNPVARAMIAIGALNREAQVLRAGRKIRSEVREQIDERQNDYFLREQMHRIKEMLGEENSADSEIDEYRKQMDSVALPEYAREKLEKEIGKLERMPYGMAEASVLQGYIECILELPWDKETEDIDDPKYALKVLNQDHYGLEKVKERILEYLAVRSLSKEKNSQILYLVGPPGIGKTSVAKSVARALGRKFERVSLGGVRDEAEIRGHRKTYVGAMPGRIITAIRHAGVNNPVILLDEIDKMSSDFRGDPSAALLEVLDAEQNSEFRDHYIEIPYDLSNVIFIATANTSDTVPRPLLDRMEAIEMNTYTAEEKYHIARNYLIPKEMLRNGIPKNVLTFRKSAILQIITHYTRESGVRNLERAIAKVCRKIALKLISKDETEHFIITEKNLAAYLGAPLDFDEHASKHDQIGVVTGLAWTSVGGVTMPIEVNILDGSGKITLTGSLGDVMKESAQAAMSFVRSISDTLDISKDFYKTKDVHIHVPEGATPKDGPSAGIAMATALASALTGIPVDHRVAMTGEITIRGRVLPIGGLKEKLLAAAAFGATRVILPNANQKDMDEIPESVKEQITFVFAEDMDAVLKNALTLFPAPRKKYRSDQRTEVSSETLYIKEKRGGRYEHP